MTACPVGLDAMVDREALGQRAREAMTDVRVPADEQVLRASKV